MSDQSFTLRSDGFEHGQPIPAQHSCDGQDRSPPLSWSEPPPDTRSLALVVDDPDAPSGTFTHWVVLDLAAGVVGSEEGSVPAGGVQAQNSAGRASYFGPCPPSGTHRYRFTVYALSGPTGLGAGAGLSEALGALEERAIAWGRLIATYDRSR
jgi:Raf kinase inhibitor-like YbhB/YbcL family protein